MEHTAGRQMLEPRHDGQRAAAHGAVVRAGEEIAALALVQAARGQIMVPALSLLWFAFEITRNGQGASGGGAGGVSTSGPLSTSGSGVGTGAGTGIGAATTKGLKVNVM